MKKVFVSSNMKELLSDIKKLKAEARKAGKAPVLSKASLGKGDPKVVARRGINGNLSSYLNTMHYQVARRFYELLSIETPKKSGRMNGSWTSTGEEVSDRVNLSNSPLPEEIANIFTMASNGNLIISISNAVEYIKYVNYGTSTISARMFVEMAMTRIQREASEKGIEVTISGSP